MTSIVSFKSHLKDLLSHFQDEKELGDDDVYDNGYGKLLKHKAKCLIKPEDLIKYREFDRNVVQIVNNEEYISEMMQHTLFSENYSTITPLEQEGGLLSVTHLCAVILLLFYYTESANAVLFTTFL